MKNTKERERDGLQITQHFAVTKRYEKFPIVTEDHQLVCFTVNQAKRTKAWRLWKQNCRRNQDSQGNMRQ